MATIRRVTQPKEPIQAAPKDGSPAFPGRALQLSRDNQSFVISFIFDPDLVHQINICIPQARWSTPIDPSRPGQQITPRIRAGLVRCRYTIPITLENASGLRRVMQQFKFGGSKVALAKFTETLKAANRNPTVQSTLSDSPASTPQATGLFDQLSALDAAQNKQPDPVTPFTQPEPNTASPSLRSLPSAPITVLRGSVSGRAHSLRIQAPRHPEDPTKLATGLNSEGLYETIMAAPGAQYIKKTEGSLRKPGRPGYFRVPVTLVTPTLMKTLREQYGLTLSPDADEKGKTPARLVAEEIDRLRRNIKLSMADAAEVRLPVPEGKAYLPYQKAGIAYALRAGNALIADEPGLGKTIQAIGVSNALPKAKRILVIAPASLKINWKREWEAWDTKGLKVHRVENGAPNSWPAMSLENEPENPDAEQAEQKAAQVVIVNFDLIEAHQYQIKRQPWDLMIIDEAHALKNQDTKRTTLILGAGSGRKRIPGIEAKRTLLLTGTPILNRPLEIWPLAHALAPAFFGDKYGFERRYCEGHKTKYGWNAKGASNLSELQRELRSRIMVRRKKNQVLKDLPPKTRQLIELDRPQQAMGHGQYRQLEKATQRVRDIFRQREALSVEVKANPNADSQARAQYKAQAEQMAREAKVAFHQMSRARKETAFSKIPQVLELAHTALDNGKLILFCHHQEVAEAYRDTLNTYFRKQAGKKGTPKTVAMVTGQTPEGQRQKEADRFQGDPKCQVFIGTIQAAGTGLTLTAASAVLFAELDWVPGNITQAEDRAHRIGQRDHVLIYHAVVEGTLDSLMVRRLIEKQAVIDGALDSPQAPPPKPKGTEDTRTESERFADWCLKHLGASADNNENVELVPGTIGSNNHQLPRPH